jgi:putative transposase
MSRHTTFKFCLDPTVEQQERLARHAGAARFAFNQCLRMVKDALSEHRTDSDVEVPWSGFDLINSFNAWKKTADAGRVFSVRVESLVGFAFRRTPRSPGRVSPVQKEVQYGAVVSVAQ